MITVLIPSAIFFYESDEDQHFCKRIFDTILAEIVTLVFTGIALFVSYYYLRESNIPIDIIIRNSTYLTDSDKAFNISSFKFNETETYYYGKTALNVSIPIYVMGIISFLGFFFFTIFGGIGISALPINLIRAFTNRPKLVI